jgi:prepilin signal peptidase PulO-like enzyme (type II secretory pathway)
MDFYLANPQVLVFMLFAIPVSLIDMRSYRIPDGLNVSCFATLLLVHILKEPESLPNFLWASLFCGILFLLIRLLAGGLGLGDVKFALSVGLFCGPARLFPALFIAAISALIAALFVRLRSNGASPRIPFGPFLCLGAIAAYSISPQILLLF